MTVPAFYDKFRIKSRCKTPLSFKLWFPAANLKNICRGRCSHRPAGTHLPPNIPPQPSHHLKSQGRAFLHSPDFNLSSLWQHRTIPALRLKHRSDGCGTASALPKCSIMSGCGTRIVLRFAVSATGGAHLCSIQYYLRFWLSICRTSLVVSALRIMRYCLKKI